MGKSTSITRNDIQSCDIKSLSIYKFIVHIISFSSNLEDKIFQFHEQSKVSGNYDRPGNILSDNRIDFDLNGKLIFNLNCIIFVYIFINQYKI